MYKKAVAVKEGRCSTGVYLYCIVKRQHLEQDRTGEGRKAGRLDSSFGNEP